MKKPYSRQYFLIEARADGDTDAKAWTVEDDAPSLAGARQTRDHLASRRPLDDPWEWRIVRVIQLVEVVE